MGIAKLRSYHPAALQQRPSRIGGAAPRAMPPRRAALVAAAAGLPPTGGDPVRGLEEATAYGRAFAAVVNRRLGDAVTTALSEATKAVAEAPQRLQEIQVRPLLSGLASCLPPVLCHYRACERCMAQGPMGAQRQRQPLQHKAPLHCVGMAARAGCTAYQGPLGTEYAALSDSIYPCLMQDEVQSLAQKELGSLPGDAAAPSSGGGAAAAAAASSSGGGGSLPTGTSGDGIKGYNTAPTDLQVGGTVWGVCCGISRAAGWLGIRPVRHAWAWP
jgi:hypothetical protein